MRHAVWIGILACDPAGTKPGDSSSIEPLYGTPSETTPEADTTTPTGLCAELWSEPVVEVDPAVERPDSSYSAVGFSLRYEIDPSVGSAVVTLEDWSGRSGADAGFGGDIYSYAGKFVQLRDSSDAVLYTQSEYYLIEESVEAPATTGFSNVSLCPDDGYILLLDYPNDPDSAWLVLLQEPIDGHVGGGVPQEIVRVPLP